MDELRQKALAPEAKWEELVSECEKYEIERWEREPNIEEEKEKKGEEEELSEDSKHYRLQLVLYLLQNDLDTARHLWKRIPSHIKHSDSELAALWTLGQNLWSRNYSQFYRAASAFEWSPFLSPLVVRLLVSIRSHLFDLLSRSYSSISLSDASSFLGLSADDTFALATQANWEARDLFLYPPLSSSSPSSSISSSISSSSTTTSSSLSSISSSSSLISEPPLFSASQIQDLTEYVVFLDK